MGDKIYIGDALAVLKTLPNKSVHCCVTSPPYWGLRDYGTAQWEGGDESCSHNPQKPDGGVRADRSLPLGRGGLYRDACKCGARRIDKQMGLEKTPEEYVAKMVEVFREVKRVLREDGTLWLNMGDGYWGGKGQSSQAWSTANQDRETLQKSQHQICGIGETRPSDGKHPILKPKDLIGMPWRLAFALQQPYYTGKIRNEADRIWLAAMIDGEGCMFIHKRKAGTSSYSKFRKKDGTEVEYNRKQDTYGAGLEVANTHESIVKRCMEITGMGSICRVERESKNKHRNIPLYRWNMRSNQCRDIIREIYPYLVGKQHEARLLLGCPSSGPDAEKAHFSLIALHNGKQATIDFPPPTSMYEPGYYLRQDVIWAKTNCMPESVTDRCTKSHEYIFLLTKSAHYYFDSDAIREPHAEWSKKLQEYQEKDSYHFSSPKHKNTKGGAQWIANVDLKLNPGGRNKRSVWTITTKPYKDAHFATFPPEIPEICIKAGTSQKGCCPECGNPWARVIDKKKVYRNELPEDDIRYRPNRYIKNKYADELRDGFECGRYSESTTIGWHPSCSHDLNPVPCTILDPFAGSGTTGQVARNLGRNFIMIELNEKYIEMQEKRTEDMFCQPEKTKKEEKNEG